MCCFRRTTLSIFLVFAATPMAFAHAILVRSTPADQSVVHRGSVNVTLDFNSRIDASRSTLILTGPSGKSSPVQIQPSANPSELKGTAVNLPSGMYRVHWQVLAGDGHITRGEIAFMVAKN